MWGLFLSWGWCEEGKEWEGVRRKNNMGVGCKERNELLREKDRSVCAFYYEIKDYSLLIWGFFTDKVVIG